MPMQQVEFEFPDPEKDEKLQEVEVKEEEVVDTNIEVEDAVGRETIGKPDKKEAAEKSEVEIEVEDDTPPADRGRKPSEPPEEVTNEELENYSDKVKKRIQHFSKGYHDERRAKEQAVREREEAIAYAQKLIEQNQELNAKGAQNHNALIESAKKQVESELAVAQKQYKEAYEAGEPDAVLQAQTLLNAAQIRLDKVNGMKQREIPANNQTTLQNNENNVQSQQLAPEQPQRDEKAEAWRTKNPWFGSDDEMTAFALGLHTKLTKEGVSPQSDEYYERINSRMRQIFPDQFDEGIEDEPEEAPKQKPSNVVAPATRSTSPKKVKLKQSQIAVAKRLGVPLEQYAKQVAELARKQNG
tara:strand:- start:1633 stop:2700 length:1068 start_codon:yes stop_codon:yes gene_type:complete